MNQRSTATISANAKALLDACAKAIVADQKSDLNLDPLSDEWDQDLHDEIPHYLAEQVEQLSN